MKLFKSLKLRCILIIKDILSIIPKDSNLIVFSAWFGEKFFDSPRYLFEYLLENSDYKVFWQTKNKDLYVDLKRRGIPAVYRYSFTGILMQIRAKMLVSTVEFSDFNKYLISNSILFDLDHGFPIKQSGHEMPLFDDNSQRIEKVLRYKVSLYKTASSKFVRDIICRTSKVDLSHIVLCNKTRTDVLFDKLLRDGNNTFVDSIIKGKKAIVYMPTHRSSGQIVMSMRNILNLDLLQRFCEEHDCFFLIKKHYYHRNELEDFSSYPNIFDITQYDIEPQTLLYQSDVLISDYSAAYIDYLLLDRPLLFYTYDYEYFIEHERNLYLRFEDNDSGFRAFCFDELIRYLKLICVDWTDSTHSLGREKIRNLYFDHSLNIGHSREETKKIIDELMSGKYVSRWEDCS